VSHLPRQRANAAPDLVSAFSHCHADGRLGLNPEKHPPTTPADTTRLWVAAAASGALVLTSDRQAARVGTPLRVAAGRTRLTPPLTRMVRAPCPVLLISDTVQTVIVTNLNHPDTTAAVLELAQRLYTTAAHPTLT